VNPYFQLQIVYEDDYMAIVNKPAGVLVYPEDGKNKNSISYALPYFLKKPRTTTVDNLHRNDDDIVLDQPVPVHRLDFATSGLLVIGKTKHSARYLANQFEFRKARKKYITMVYGRPNINTLTKDTINDSNGILKFLPEDERTVRTKTNTTADGWNKADCLLEDKRSTTYWRVKSTHEFIIASTDNKTTSVNSSLSSERITKLPISMVEMKPITGRYHQLRRQLAYMYKTPIVGDPNYAREYVKKVFSNHDGGSTLMDRYHRGLMLCSNEIALAHPFFNTPHGKNIWNANMNGRDFSNSTLGSSVVLFEDEDGTVMVNATIKLPKKFDKFLKVMERMTEYSNTTSTKP
jgi:23S rRNA-/tRNA-specific pseudouridylate synthase